MVWFEYWLDFYDFLDDLIFISLDETHNVHSLDLGCKISLFYNYGRAVFVIFLINYSIQFFL